MFEWPNINKIASNNNCVGIDIETFDPNLKDMGPGVFRKDGFITGIAIATLEEQWYLPLQHSEGNLDPNRVIEFMKDLADTGVNTVGANYTYDLLWLKSYGVNFKGKVYDCQLAESLLDENKFTFKLDVLALEYEKHYKDTYRLVEYGTKVLGLKEEAIIKNMPLFPANEVAEYAKMDALLALKILNKQMVKLKEEEVFSVFEMETALTKIFLEMMYKGVRIDLEKVEKENKLFKLEEEQQLINLRKEAGCDFNPWSSEDCGKVFDKLNIQYLRTAKTEVPSITENNMKAIYKKDTPAFVKSLFEYRHNNKIRKDFLEKILLCQVNGRVYAQIHQNKKDANGTRSGRLSMSNPNLQQQPARIPKWKKAIRSCYLPEEGYKWVKNDYSQQEFRLFIHYAFIRKFNGADEVVAKYLNNPKIDYHTAVAEIMQIERQPAKTINFGILYGMGKAKLSDSLSLSMEEAAPLLAQYHKMIPFTKGIANECSEYASSRGWIKTILGRKRRFNLYEPVKTDKDWKEGIFYPAYPLEKAKEEYPNRLLQRAKTYAALNSLIQGSAADMTKKAILDIYREFKEIPALQVHDELNYSNILMGDDFTTLKKVKKMMETTLNLAVPIVADCSYGNSWGELTEYKEA